MNRVVNYLMYLFLFFFILVSSVNAECSYQERKNLLNEAKSVDIVFNVDSRKEKIETVNPNTEEIEIIEDDKFYFNLNISNLTNDLFIKVTNNLNSDQFIVNSEDLKDGLYSYEIDNMTDIITYHLDFYSTYNNCYAEKILSRQIKKPKENPVYYFSVCSDERLENNKYCQRFIENDFNMKTYDIVSKLNKILEEENEPVVEKNFSAKKVKQFFAKYWYLFVVTLIVIIGVITLLIIRKKRSKL